MFLPKYEIYKQGETLKRKIVGLNSKTGLLQEKDFPHLTLYTCSCYIGDVTVKGKLLELKADNFY